MPPSDVQTLLLDVIRQQAASPWLTAVLALIGAAVGAYFAGYLRRRGEDRAVREGFAQIREQLKVTTRDTEQIKQRLSGRAWRSQQEWSARERYYSQLLTHLHHFKLALDELSDYYIEPGTEHIPDEERGERFQALRTDASKAYAEAEKLLGASALYLAPSAVLALERLFTQHWGLANFEAICTADYVAGATKLAKEAYGHVLSEARNHLGIAVDA
jgi:hypothetical protein